MKYTILLMITLFVFTFTACSGNSATPAGSEPSAVASESDFVYAEGNSEAADTEESAPIDSTVSNDPTESSEQPSSSKAPDSTISGGDNQATTTSKATNSPATPKSETTKPPASSEPPATTTPPPTTTQPPATSEPTQPAFDINYWIQFAKDYGKSIGLIYDEGTTGSWDTPIAAGPTLKYIERDIKGYLNGYVQSGVKYFSVWAESRQDGSGKYDIYIGYA